VKTRPLGRIPHCVSEIGLGTAQLANTSGEFRGVRHVSSANAQSIIESAISHGVSFFDTADRYGTVESMLGELKPELKAKIFVATKAGLTEDGQRDFSASYLKSRVDHSRNQLCVDSLDLFQLNKPKLSDLQDGRLFEFLSWLKETGRSRYCGVVIGDLETGDLCLEAEPVDCIQVMYNLLYLDTDDLIGRAHESGIGVIARSPLNSGMLSGAYTVDTTFGSEDERSNYFTTHVLEERLRVVSAILDELPLPVEHLLNFALRFILANKAISVVIPGASTIAQVNSYVAASQEPAISAGDLERIKSIVGGHLQSLRQTFQT